MQGTSKGILAAEDPAMFVHVLGISTLIVGINVGWQPIPEGGMEYIIQLDPQTLDALKAGETIQSDIPPGAGHVRTYKIIMGTKKLPRINQPTTSGGQPSTKPLEGARTSTLNLTENATTAQTSAFPGPLLPEPGRKPLTADSASYEASESPGKSKTSLLKEPGEKKEEPGKPWLPLILASLALFASFGGNVYLVWIFADLRRRYRLLLSKENCYSDAEKILSASSEFNG